MKWKIKNKKNYNNSAQSGMSTINAQLACEKHSKQTTLRQCVCGCCWQQVSVLTLTNAWKKLIQDMDVLVDFTGFEPKDFVAEMNRGGSDDVMEEDVIDWLQIDADDPGYHHITDAEIAESVSASQEVTEASDDEEMPDEDMPKLSRIRQCMDEVLKWLDRVDDRDAQKYYPKLRDLRNAIITRQHATTETR